MNQVNCKTFSLDTISLALWTDQQGDTLKINSTAEKQKSLVVYAVLIEISVEIDKQNEQQAGHSGGQFSQQHF